MGLLQSYQGARYPIVHAVHAAVLAELVAEKQGMPAPRRLSLLAAALTHDIGFLSLQEELDRQKTPLTDEQRHAIALHTIESKAVLERAGVTDPMWLDAVLHHHERLDGSGYPFALRGDALSSPARILALADIYSAMTKPRAYRDAILDMDAMRDIFISRGSAVGAELARDFVRLMGVYPPGAFVRLASGETAVVVRRARDVVSPEVRVVLDANERRLVVYPVRKAEGKAHRVIETLPRESYLRIPINHHLLWGSAVEQGLFGKWL